MKTILILITMMISGLAFAEGGDYPANQINSMPSDQSATQNYLKEQGTEANCKDGNCTKNVTTGAITPSVAKVGAQPATPANVAAAQGGSQQKSTNSRKGDK